MDSWTASSARLLIRSALLIGCLTVNVTAQKKDNPLKLNLLSPSPERAAEETVKLRDPLRVDPARYQLELETEGMRVLRLRLGADETSLMHYGRDTLVVCLSECHIRLTRPDGTDAAAWFRYEIRQESDQSTSRNVVH